MPPRMPDDRFHLVDLASQAAAVQRHLAGKTGDEKLDWLARRGRLVRQCTFVGHGPVYHFQSPAGPACAFFLRGDTIVFFGDNTTWTAKEP